MQEYLRAHWVEIAGALLSVVYLVLSIREKAGLWIFGFISSAFYVFVFFESKFYADMSLQFYYLAVSVFGWINWHRKTTGSDSAIIPTTTIARTQYSAYIAAIVVTYLIYYVILKYWTDSPVPVLDSLVGALSVVATWMLARKKIENWLLWIAADALAAGLFLYKGLYPTVVLYVIYTSMAVVGYFQWKKHLQITSSEI
ncbi:MAG TPA: nicotinamide riboside transporter PnuC [Paludibacteraceae bacterium]|nr:nicotinamide riboside transporter PnuC [Paludibacteraceae bacterium]